MSLEAKRALKAFQETEFPKLSKEIESYVACPLEVDWNSIVKDAYIPPTLWSQAFEKVYFRSVIDGFKELSSDDLGKEAIQKSIKKIEFCNSGGKYGPEAISLANGTLKIDHHPCSNIDDIQIRSKKICDLVAESF